MAVVWVSQESCSKAMTGKVAMWLKLNPAQQNYPVHEIEMLARVESMLRHAFQDDCDLPDMCKDQECVPDVST